MPSAQRYGARVNTMRGEPALLSMATCSGFAPSMPHPAVSRGDGTLVPSMVIGSGAMVNASRTVEDRFVGHPVGQLASGTAVSVSDIALPPDGVRLAVFAVTSSCSVVPDAT